MTHFQSIWDVHLVYVRAVQHQIGPNKTYIGAIYSAQSLDMSKVGDFEEQEIDRRLAMVVIELTQMKRSSLVVFVFKNDNNPRLGLDYPDLHVVLIRDSDTPFYMADGNDSRLHNNPIQIRW